MPINIMAVDDEPSTLNLLRIMIRMKRPAWAFHAALGSEQALALAARQPLDFILLDISMPGMNGFEVCRRLRTMPATANVPIAMFTALDTTMRREESRAAGATAFWVKPFGPAQLIADVERLITHLSP